MANLIRFGTTVVNLNRVTHAIAHGLATTVYFSADEEDFLVFRDDDGVAVAAYLEGAAIDVKDWYDRQKQLAAEEASRKTAFHANLAFLENCTHAGGHVWTLAPADGHDCIHCGAHCGQQFIGETIACWGGTVAKRVVS